MKKLLALLISIVLCFSLFTACKVNNNDDGDSSGGGLGSLKMTSFKVDETSIKTSYLVNEDVDFSGIKVNIMYSDKNYNKALTYNDLTFVGLENLTATPGEKTVTVKYNDAVIANAVRSADILVNVYRSAEELKDYVVTSYTDPVFLTQRKGVVAKAGTANYGDAQYSGQFFGGQDTTYYVGDDNKFKFVPVLTALNDELEEVKLPTFISSVKVSLKVNNAYVDLVPTTNNDNYDVTYAYENNVLVTVDTYNNTYQFAKDGSAVGKEFKIEVVPADFYNFELAKVSTIEVKVIDAFNVYTAKELSVIDNMQSGADGAWAEIKQSLGLLGTTVNGVVLHNDINILEKDLPASFFTTAEKTITFSDGDDTNNIADVTINAGDKVLKDYVYIYHRQSTSKFTFNGNYFTVSVASLPQVGADALFNTLNKDAGIGYSTDFSNSCLFLFYGSMSGTNGTTNDDPAEYINFEFNNTQFIGNASRNELRATTNEDPLSAGGLILCNSRKANATMTNVIQNSFFIAYMANSQATYNTRSVLNLNYVKCYDSYQNAGFIWGNAEINVTNSNLENAGGPLFILQDVIEEHAIITGAPGFNADNNSTLISMVNGAEFWFSSVNASSKVGEIKALNAIVSQLTGGKSYLNSADPATAKMNLILASMPNADNVDALINPEAYASMTIGDFTVDRNLDSQFWAGVKANPLFAAGAPVFGNGVNDMNNIAALAFSGKTFLPDYSYFGTSFATGLANSKYISLTQLGLSVIFELYTIA